MNDQIEEVNLEARIGQKKKGGRVGGKNRSRSRSGRKDRSRERGEVKDKKHIQNGSRGGNTVVIKNMMASNRISEIMQDIKLRAGDIKSIEIQAIDLNLRNSDDTPIDIQVTFFDPSSCNRCIKQYHEAHLDNQVLQCYRLND